MKNKNIYYGILFYFIYTQIYETISSLLISPILIMQWNIHLILILLLFLILILSIWFYKVEKFPRIKIWLILIVVCCSILVKFFNIPTGLYLSNNNYVFNLEKQSLITNYIQLCRIINIIIFLGITYLKYSIFRKDIKQTMK